MLMSWPPRRGDPLLKNTDIAKRNGGSVLINDTLNKSYLRLYGVGHIVKDHPDNERGNNFRLAARDILYAPYHRQNSNTTNVIQVVEHCLERQISQRGSSRSDDPWHHERTLYQGATSRSDIIKRVKGRCTIMYSLLNKNEQPYNNIAWMNCPVSQRLLRLKYS